MIEGGYAEHVQWCECHVDVDLKYQGDSHQNFKDIFNGGLEEKGERIKFGYRLLNDERNCIMCIESD